MAGSGVSLPVQRLNSCEGRFDVVCAVGDDGATHVSRQSVCAPFHLTKTYWDGHALLVQCVNCTAGVFSGDRLGINIRVESGARVLLTSPSAHRIHTMPEGEATMTQQYTIGEGAWLEVMPELFIPQAGCRYRQSTRIDLAEKASLFFVETLTPGRVARGEVFAFERVGWTTEVFRAGRRLVRERNWLTLDDASLWSLRKRFPAAYYASCLVAADPAAMSDETMADIESIAGERVAVGVTSPATGIWVVKILACDSLALKAALRRVRSGLQTCLPGLRASARKL